MLLHENPAIDRRIRQFMEGVYNQSQRQDQQRMPDFAAMTYAQLQAVAPLLDAQVTQALEAVVGLLPESGGAAEQLAIDGPDGNTIPIEVFRPTGRHSGLLPCIIYCHGGGMAFTSVRSYRPLLQHLADQGAVVVAPEFRSSAIARFPAGVQDCLATVIWARAHLSSLGVNRVVLAGESGGGCLALTVPLIACRGGLEPAALLDGVWADGPLCNGHAAATAAPRSYVDNLLLIMRRMYTDQQDDPCAFPSNAPQELLQRFPRTVIIVYEFDPLRNDAIAFYRMMLAANHSDVDCMQIHGLTHCSMISKAIVPSFSTRQLQRLVAFAR